MACGNLLCHDATVPPLKVFCQITLQYIKARSSIMLVPSASRSWRLEMPESDPVPDTLSAS